MKLAGCGTYPTEKSYILGFVVLVFQVALEAKEESRRNHVQVVEECL